MKGLKILFLLENSNSHLGGVATLMYMLKKWLSVEGVVRGAPLHTTITPPLHPSSSFTSLTNLMLIYGDFNFL